MNGRTRAVASNVLNRLRHDRRTLGMVIMMPVIFMVLFGFAFSGEPKDVALIVVDEDAGVSIPSWALPILAPILANITTNSSSGMNLSFSRPVMDDLLSDDTVRLRISADSGRAKDQVKRGKAWAFLYFPQNYSKWVLSGLVGSVLSTRPAGINPLSIQIARKRIESLTHGGTPSSKAVLYADRSNTQVYSPRHEVNQQCLLGLVQAIRAHWGCNGVLQDNQRLRRGG